MSRGPGDLQRAILAYVDEATDDITVEGMRWTLYKRLEKPPIASNGALPNEWNTSFTRAVKNLACESRSLLRIEPRHLASLEECIAHYPGKTLSAAIRLLRQVLLPALLAWTRDRDGASPHYNLAENEEYAVRRISTERARWLNEEWARLESLMRPAFARSGSEDLFLLFCKGRSLFQGTRIKSPLSFTDAAQKCCAAGILPGVVTTQVLRFAKDFLPRGASGSLELKSFVHEFAFVPDRGQCSLREDTLKELHHRRKGFVEAMPGFRPVTRGLMRKPTYDRAIHRLFDQTVFQEFNFVRRFA